MEKPVEIQTLYKGRRVLHDPIHGSFYLPDLTWSIIDTPIFQRLRHIKQTGNTCYVYPGAEHTRFQHCLGVSYMCLNFGRLIKSKYPDLICDKDVILLCIAGLCHDLGHCAYSHLYDSSVIPRFDPSSTFTHEEGSCMLLDLLYNSTPELRNALTPEDINTVCKMILGSPDNVPMSLRDRLQWVGRDLTHSFLYEIVSNARTGIDVDKFDYLRRDCHYTGISCSFDPQRLLAFFYIIKVADAEGDHYRIEYHRRGEELIGAMWAARNDLHHKVYQHRVTKCIDLMVAEMIYLCGDYELTDDNGNKVKLREAHHQLDTYCQLVDYKILSIAETIPEAKVILDRIRRRRLWVTLATLSSNTELEYDQLRILTEFDSKIKYAYSKFRDGYKYYIFYSGDIADISPVFYELLITCAGESIIEDIKD